MRIRNDHPGSRLVPHTRELVEPGDTIDWPTGLRVPDGFSVVTAPKPAKHRKPSEPASPAPTSDPQEND